MDGIVDLHAHVLPGLDDGPADEAESTDVLEMLADEGVTTVVATPHVNGQWDVTPARVREAIAALSKPPVEVLPGAEVHIGQLESVLSGDDPRGYTLGGRGTLLLELESSVLVSSLQDSWLRLAGAWLSLLLAHVKRW